MRLIHTGRQKERAKNPTRLDILKELNKRSALDGKLKNELYRLQAGSEGEQAVLNCIEKFGLKHWYVMKNIWLDYYGSFECDLILMTAHSIYIFEVKNYSEDFTYKNNQCYLNGNKIGHNAISQAIRAAVNFENMFRDSNYWPTIKSGIIFTGEYCNVQIFDEVDGLHISTLSQLRSLIEKIADEDRGHPSQSIDTERTAKILNAYEIENPFTGELIADEVKEQAKLGILCHQCNRRRLTIGRKFIRCACRASEPFENAIVRTICEYGVIYNERELLTKEVYAFFEEDLSRDTVRKYLRKHFEEVNNKSNHFTNKGLPFRYLLNNFELPQKKIQISVDYN
jgi:Holliday junction resolvase-like predicted endonuclease